MHDFSVKGGLSAETSGGLLIMIDKDRASDFQKAAKDQFGHETWLVGEIVKGERNAKIVDDVDVISVSKSFLE